MKQSLLKKLIPVFVYQKSYIHGGTNDPNPKNLTNTFVSSGKICKYARFTQTNTNSQISLYPNNEVILASLPNWLYKVEYSLSGRAKFWRYTSKFDKAFQVYDIRGNLIDLSDKQGYFYLYAFSFPILVELQGSMQMTITATKELEKHDPLLVGDHCLNGQLIYTNVYDGRKVTRIVAPEFQLFNEYIRAKHFAVSSNPCIIVSEQDSATRTLVVNEDLTVNIFALKIGALFRQDLCYRHLWLKFQDSFNGFSISPDSNYFHADKTQNYILGHDFTIALNFDFFHRCNYPVELMLVNYELSYVIYTCPGLIVTIDNERQYQFKSTNAISKVIQLVDGLKYYFVITNFIHTTTATGILLSNPYAITSVPVETFLFEPTA